MTREEARAVVQIMMTADGECVVCSARLIQQFVERWPEHEGVADEVWSVERSPGGWREW